MPESPLQISSGRLIARCWEPGDAPAFRALLDRNNQHLRPFIQWMRDEPMALDGTRERLANYRRRFLAGEDFRYALLDTGGKLVGELMLSTRSGGNSREVGFLLDRNATGNGYATEAALMALWAAFDISTVDHVELHCSPLNTPSVRIAEKLGFTLTQTLLQHAMDSEGVMQDSMQWRMNSGDFRQRFQGIRFTVPE